MLCAHGQQAHASHSSGFSRLPWLSKGPDAFRLLSWNARALLHWDTRLARRKVRFLASAIRSPTPTVALVQELHGSEEELTALLYTAACPIHVFVSEFPGVHDQGPSRSKGGLAFVVPAGTAPRSSFELIDVLPGRIAALRFTTPSSSWTAWNVHNYEVSRSALSRLSSAVHEGLAAATADPRSHFVSLTGDLNFLAQGDTAHSLEAPEPAGLGFDAPPPPRPLQREWEALLDGLTEVHQPLPTHFRAQTKAVSRLDRCFLAMPSWALLRHRITATLLADPHSLHTRGLSDHAPMCVELRAQPQRPHNTRTIPRFVTAHPLFRRTLDQRLNSDPTFHELSPPLQLPRLKEHLRAAAKTTRDVIIHGADDSRPELRAMTYRSIARAIWFQDHKLASLLRQRSLLGSKFIASHRDGSLRISDPTRFDLLFNEAQLADKQRTARAAMTRIADATAAGLVPDGPVAARLRSRQRRATDALSQAWSPFGKRVYIQAVRLADRIEDSPEGMSAAFAAAWSPVFATAHTPLPGRLLPSLRPRAPGLPCPTSPHRPLPPFNGGSTSPALPPRAPTVCLPTSGPALALPCSGPSL